MARQHQITILVSACLPNHHKSISALKSRISFGTTLRILFLCTAFMGMVSLFITPTIQAQSISLDEISTAQRSDGKGYVVRLGMDAPADSFRVFQPDASLIQIALFTSSSDTSSIDLVGIDNPFDHISYQPIEHGIGIDIYLKEDSYFIADIYPDGGSEDILVGLTDASKNDIQVLTDGISPIQWELLAHQPEDMILDSANVELASEVDSGNAESTRPQDNEYYDARNKMKFDVVVIDAGHGGRDPGSLGYRGVKEKNVTLAVALKLGEYIEKYLPDVKVVYTRDDDTFIGLQERGRYANKHEGDLFVSIHCNSFHRREAHGSEVFFLGMHKSKDALEVAKKENSVIALEDDPGKQKLSENELLIYELANSAYMSTSEKIAGMIEQQFDERAQRYSRGVKQAGFVVLYHASMPAVLVELGFLTNPGEKRFLTSDYGQSIMASALFRAIRDYKEKYEKSQHYTTN
jgi:N-acetylmuramoyl-L-alanine amidase